jgi:hypothetical protein
VWKSECEKLNHGLQNCVKKIPFQDGVSAEEIHLVLAKETASGLQYINGLNVTLKGT